MLTVAPTPPHLYDPDTDAGCTDEPVLIEHRVTIADGFSGVVKVAQLLRNPACDITGFSAQPAPGPNRWTVNYACAGTAPQLQMLRKRVYRLPVVTKIECRQLPAKRPELHYNRTHRPAPHDRIR